MAGRRWAVEESFQAGKELAGLDEHQVRRWTSWHRWTVLAMLAHAFLAVTAATERARAAPPAGLIPLTPNEIRRLFIGLLTRPVRDANPPAALVAMATPPPSRRTRQPLPPPRPPTRMITIYGWSTSTSGASPQPDKACPIGTGPYAPKDPRSEVADRRHPLTDAW